MKRHLHFLGLKYTITLIAILCTHISRSQTDFMDYLPQHLSHLDTYTWDKVQRGVLVRYRHDPPFPSEAVDIIAKKCMFINLQSNLTQSSREDFTIPYPKRIYRFTYKNLVRHYTGLDTVFSDVPEWFMYNAGGSPNVYLNTVHPYYNLLNTNTEYFGKKIQEWWISDMQSRIDDQVPGHVMFVDALTDAIRIGQGAAHGGYDYWGNKIGEDPYYDNSYTEDYLKPLLASIRDEFADKMIITGNFLKPWFLPDGNYSYVKDYAHCNYIENFERYGDSYTEHLNTGIELYKTISEDGKMTFFNMSIEKPTPAPTLTIEEMRTKALDAMPEFYSSLPNQTEKDDLAELYAYFEFRLAIFLLGANEYSYMAYQSTPIADDAGKDLFRTIPPFPEFEYPLGEPLGAAIRNGDIWTREFKHASVWLDAAKGLAKVDWEFKSLGVASLNLEDHQLKVIPNVINQDTYEVIIQGVPFDQKDIKLFNLNGQLISQNFSYVDTYTGDDGKRYNKWKLFGYQNGLSKGIYIIKSGHLNTYLIVN
ncbi:putative glycoside hydrolase [Mariniflexile gromovii]|uniref:Secreted protein (Por secretion system target) n=1 Tax=Mariniflexile gromovii TaxID=362523 RepID=A0ABS4BWH0_9FLAO|nr:putative glycoside hydrolase [Mariniflexile gromovii]MBP0904935.1 hypothetical protein [Mariniflexile gromovii]